MAKNPGFAPLPDYDKSDGSGEIKVKIICLGDSAVGKSKLVERFLMDGYKPQQLSTYALTLFNYKTEHNKQAVSVECDDDKKDVVILLDSSSSVKARNFRKATNFVVDVIDKFEISKEKVRIGLVRFSSKISRILWLNQSFNKTKIKLVIKNLRYNGGGTFTGSALHFINKNILNAKNGDRDDAPDLVIVITDGDSSNPEQTKSEAKLLHDRKVEIVSIGVGKNVKETELLNIASDKAFAIRVNDFDELSNKNLHDRLFKATCEDFWDTAGQERFNNMHPSYYHQAHACIIVFDATRKVTYKNLPDWLKELREYRPEIPCLCAANKIDADPDITKRNFGFAKKHNMPFYFVSASEGTNVVKLFKDAIKAAVAYKNNPTDFMDEIMNELENFELETDKTLGEKDEISDSGLDSPHSATDTDKPNS